AADPDDGAGHMGCPHRHVARDVVHARCLPGAGRLTRLRRRGRSLSPRMGSLDSSRLLVKNRARGRAPHIGALSDRALEKGGSVLLKPIIKIEVVTPEDYASSVIADLNSGPEQERAV